MARNYYVVLGLHTNATQEQIKSAYRQKAKQYHPDYYGHDCKPFQEVQEAYEVLSDPDSRRAYDRQMDRERRIQHDRSGVWSEPMQWRPGSMDPVMNPTPWHTSGSFRTLFDAFLTDLLTRAQPRVSPLEDLAVEITITPLQAQRGGRVRVWIPAEAECPACWGWGNVGLYRCETCSGTGRTVQEYPVTIAFPAGIPHGFTTRLPLDRLGFRGLDLLVRFKVTM